MLTWEEETGVCGKPDGFNMTLLNKIERMLKQMLKSLARALIFQVEVIIFCSPPSYFLSILSHVNDLAVKI